MEKLMCGAAIGDISPLAEEIEGLESLQRKKIGGIIDSIHVRAISVFNGRERLLFICFELDKAPYPFLYMKEISEKYGVNEENIIFAAAHVHSVPVLGDRTKDGPNNIKEKSDFIKNTTHAYEKRIHDVVINTVGQALRKEEDALLGTGLGSSLINVDRKCKYNCLDKDGCAHFLIALGQNRGSDIDHTVNLLRFEDLAGKPIAFLVNYPVHCTVMHGNSVIDGKLGISSDIAGRVSISIEKEYPDAVCIWTSGAAGDINPAMQCELTYPDPVTGAPIQEMIPGNTTPILRNIALQHFKDVDEIAKHISPSEKEIELKSLVHLCKSQGRYEDYFFRLQMIRIGKIALLAISGELFSYYSSLVKEVLPDAKIIIINHVCSLGIESGYIPDKNVFQSEKCWLPGVDLNGNFIPANFEKTFISNVMDMYKRLFENRT